MNCNDSSKLMTDLLSGELSDASKKELLAHIESCEACKKDFEELQKLWTFTEKALKSAKFADSLAPSNYRAIFEAAKEKPKRSWAWLIPGLPKIDLNTNILDPSFWIREFKATSFVNVMAALGIAVVLLASGLLLPVLSSTREKARKVAPESAARTNSLEGMEKEASDGSANSQIVSKPLAASAPAAPASRGGFPAPAQAPAPGTKPMPARQLEEQPAFAAASVPAKKEAARDEQAARLKTASRPEDAKSKKAIIADAPSSQMAHFDRLSKDEGSKSGLRLDVADKKKELAYAEAKGAGPEILSNAISPNNATYGNVLLVDGHAQGFSGAQWQVNASAKPSAQNADVPSLLKESQELFDSKQYASARDSAEKALAREPYNEEAIKLLQESNRRLYADAEKRWDKEALEHMGEEASLKWGQGIPPIADMKSGKSNFYAKLQQIKIDEMEFDKAKISSIINYLNAKAKELDSDKKGAGIVLQMTQEELAQTPEISMSFYNITVFDAIRYVCQAAGLKYRVEEKGVVIGKDSIGGAEPDSQRKVRGSLPLMDMKTKPLAP